MAAEVKFEQPKMEQTTAPIQEQEKEVAKIANEEKVMEPEKVKDEEKKSEVKEEDEQKTKDIAVIEERKIEDSKEEIGASPSGLQKSSSFKEESNLLSDLKENEKKALAELRSKIEESILENKLFEEKKEKEKEKEISSAKDVEDKDQNEKSIQEDSDKKETSEQVEMAREVVSALQEVKIEEGETVAKTNLEEKEIPVQETKGDITNKTGDKEKEEKNLGKGEEAENAVQQTVDKDISLWGVPLLASKGDNRTDVVLLKVLRAREFKVNEAFEMLRNILKWRKENNIDSILDEEIEVDVSSLSYMEGHDRNGHPLCYNNFAVLGNEDMNGKTFEEKRDKYMRGRIQLMEKGIQKLDFKPGGVCALLQINDLKNTPLPTRKELRSATKKAVELLQDNYPEYVAKNIFINVPFWYYAYSALFAPSLSQRTKNKFVYARTTKVTDTLLKYISPSQIPVQYGGLKRENDSEFSLEDEAKEAFIKAGGQETIEIPAPEVGNTIIWDLAVSGWEVNYKEEFIPADESSYTIIVQKGKRITLQEGTVRNSFTNKEPGKIVITIENGAFKKKRVLYRYKTKTSS